MIVVHGVIIVMIAKVHYSKKLSSSELFYLRLKNGNVRALKPPKVEQYVGVDLERLNGVRIKILPH